jgi:aminodeoxychorismate synthase component I
MTTSLQSQEDFLKNADKGLIKPLYYMRNLPEFDPASAFLALLDDREPYLLESARISPGTGRYSFMGSNPYMSFRCKGNQVEITRDGRRSFASRPPLAKLRELMSGYRLEQVPGLPPFTGGCVGLISYDFVHNFEHITSLAEDDLKIPDAHFIFVDLLAAYDHYEGKFFIIASPGAAERGLGYASPEADQWPEIYEKTVARMRELEERLLGGTQSARPGTGPSPGARLTARPLMSQNDYEQMVRRAKKYIAAGDIFQANLSQRLSADVEGINPYDIYRVLREVNPSPFACYLDFGDVKIISSSPERLVRLEGGRVDTRPIAGTRPRGQDMSGDEAMRSELLLNEKERAEHIMLIDLERNDIGRVCDYGSVHVDELMVTEDYSHVIHIVSNITGRLADGKDAFDVIRATFPGGTITGVPKVRCMEIIDELEPVARGPYTGSAGYIGHNGNMDLNIIIRTFVIKDNKAYVQVGAGIVADSDPEREYYETLHKAQALVKTLERL